MKKQIKLDCVKGFKTLTKEEKRKTSGGLSGVGGNLIDYFYDKFLEVNRKN